MTNPRNMVPLRDSVIHPSRSALNRFEPEVATFLSKAMPHPDEVYDHCFDKYVDTTGPVVALPPEARSCMFSKEMMTQSYDLYILTDQPKLVVRNERGENGERKQFPEYITAAPTWNWALDVNMRLSNSRPGLGLRKHGPIGKEGESIIYSPTMPKYDEVQKWANTYAAVHNKVILYNAVLAFLIRTLDTTGQLKTVWPSMVQFLPAENKMAITKIQRKTWPAKITRLLEQTDYSQHDMERLLATISSNILAGAMMDDVSVPDVLAGSPLLSIGLASYDSATPPRYSF